MNIPLIDVILHYYQFLFPLFSVKYDSMKHIHSKYIIMIADYILNPFLIHKFVLMIDIQANYQSHSIVLVNLNEVWNLLKSAAFSLKTSEKTTSNIVRINLKGRLGVSNEWSLEGAMYINLC